MNTLKTTLFLIVLTLLLIFVGHMVAGVAGAVFAFFLALIMNLVSYWWSDKIVLRMYRAKEILPQENPKLHSIVENLAQAAGLSKPRIWLVPLNVPNAFATGRNPKHASIAGAIMTIAYWARWAVFLGTSDEEGGGSLIGLLAISILAPLAALLIQLAISRTREYQADRRGANLSGKPLYLASALEKIEMWSRRRPLLGPSPSTAHLFIVNPFRGDWVVVRLFSTHPPTEERVKRLKAMAGLI